MRLLGNLVWVKVVREMKVFLVGDFMVMCKVGVEIYFKLIFN